LLHSQEYIYVLTGVASYAFIVYVDEIYTAVPTRMLKGASLSINDVVEIQEKKDIYEVKILSLR